MRKASDVRSCTFSRIHCVKYQNFILFTGVEILLKRTVSAELLEIQTFGYFLLPHIPTDQLVSTG